MEAATAEDLPLRPTGKLERWNIARNHLNFYNNIQVSATYAIPGTFILTHGLLPIIYSALSESLKTQPILGVAIEDEGSLEPKWKRLPTIDFREIVQVDKRDDSMSHDEWITAGHRERLDRVDELPLWRIRITVPPSTRNSDSGTSSFDLAFFCHHGIADGLSAAAFHLTFLPALNHLISNPSSITSTPIITVPKITLVPNLEMSTKLPLTPWFTAKKIFAALVYSPSSPKTWSGPPVQSSAPTKPPISNLLSFSFSDEVVKKLVSKCRAQKTTVTNLITVLVARKLATMYPSHSRFVGQIPFSLRRFMGHSPLDMGCYISNIEPRFSSEDPTPPGYISCLSSSLPGDEHSLWNSARECKALIDSVTSSPTNQNTGLLVFVSDFRKYFFGSLGRKREYAFEVTNIGVLDGGLGGGVGGQEKLGGLAEIGLEDGVMRATFNYPSFSSALSTYGHPYCISIVTVKNGEMSVGVSWQDGVIGAGEARGLREWLERSLRGIAERFVLGEREFVEVEERKDLGWGLWAGAGLVLASGVVWALRLR